MFEGPANADISGNSVSFPVNSFKFHSSVLNKERCVNEWDRARFWFLILDQELVIWSSLSNARLVILCSVEIRMPYEKEEIVHPHPALVQTKQGITDAMARH